MDNLWAPWRISYIRAKKGRGCIFCKSIKSPDKKNYVFKKSRYSFAMLNIYPYNNGHAMVCPRRHVKNLQGLQKKELFDIFDTLTDTIRRLDRALKPQGYNIGINISDFAGAGVKGHLHIHIVPRWKGDTNFMPVVYNTKIISQSLNELFHRLKNDKPKRAK